MSKEISRRQPQGMQMMAGMGDMFQRMMIPQIKQISPDANFLERFGHNWRVSDFVKIAEGEARIIKAQAQTFDAMMTVFERVATYNERLNLQYLEMQHRKAMMSMEEKEKQAIIMGIILENEIKQGRVKQLDLENKLSEIETEARINELREHMLGRK
ncbi:MAG: hypothetical protein WC853_09030 [Thermodesulfovibrionales bacterium]